MREVKYSWSEHRKRLVSREEKSIDKGGGGGGEEERGSGEEMHDYRELSCNLQLLIPFSLQIFYCFHNFIYFSS